jgi:hypothetical protein
MSTALALPADVTIGTETIPTGTNRAFVFGSKVYTPDDNKITLHASNYISVPTGHAYILGAVRETIYNRGVPFLIPSEVTFNAQLLSCLDILECMGQQEAFLRIKMAGMLTPKSTKADVCDAVHLVKLQHNTLVEIKKQLENDTYDKSDFSDGAIAVIESYFSRIGDDAPMEKAEIAKLEVDCNWRVSPIKKTAQEDGSFVESIQEGFTQSSEFVGLLKRQTTRGTVPVPKKRQRELEEEDLKTRLEQAEEEISKYRKVFSHIGEVPGTSGVLVVTSMARATQTTIDGSIAFVISNDKA